MSKVFFRMFPEIEVPPILIPHLASGRAVHTSEGNDACASVEFRGQGIGIRVACAEEDPKRRDCGSGSPRFWVNTIYRDDDKNRSSYAQTVHDNDEAGIGVFNSLPSLTKYLAEFLLPKSDEFSEAAYQFAGTYNVRFALSYAQLVAWHQVKDDMANARIPQSVSTFAKLHDYLDANYYGNAFYMNGPRDGDNDSFTDCHHKFWNQVQDYVNNRLRDRRMEKLETMIQHGKPCPLSDLRKQCAVRAGLRLLQSHISADLMSETVKVIYTDGGKFSGLKSDEINALCTEIEETETARRV